MLCASVWLRPDDARQQRRRRRVDVDADRVDAVLHHRIERAGEPGLVDVVLVLADADGLGLDLDQLGQRVLQAPRDRHGAAQADVEIGELLGRQLGGRIDRGAGLRHHHLGELRAPAACAISSATSLSVSRLAGAVADADRDRPCASGTARQAWRASPFQSLLRLVRIDGGGVDAACRSGRRRRP